MFESSTTRRRRRRSSRNRRREIRRAIICVAAALAVVASFVATVVLLQPDARLAVSMTAEPTTTRSTDVVLEPEHADSSRAVYPFSVIPGGAYSSAEFMDAVTADAAVGAHYADIVPAAMHVERVTGPRAAYMSYRIGDRIYWTKRKLALAEGEHVLTDGRVTVRARCGNRLSEQPMQPTSEAEPPVQAFEREGGTPLVEAPLPAPLSTFEPPLGLAALPPMEPGMQPLTSSDPWDAVPFLGGIGNVAEPFPLFERTRHEAANEGGDGPIEFVFPRVFGGEPGSGGISDGPPNGPNPGGDHQDPPRVTVDIPGFTNPPGDGPPSGDWPHDNPPIDGPNNPGHEGELPPPVVPEPTSMTLLGTGIAYLALKRSRRRRKSE